MRRAAAAILAGVSWLALDLVLGDHEARAEGAPAVFGLHVAIARDGADAAVDDAWVERQIADANRFFVPLGVSFRWTHADVLSEPHGEAHSRADRDALATLLVPRVVNVFVVRALEDVDEPGRYRMGVSWRRRYIVLSRTARPTVLAHELSHLFGNHEHSVVKNNLMSYERDGADVFLDGEQAETIRRHAKGYLDSATLWDVGPPRRFL